VHDLTRVYYYNQVNNIHTRWVLSVLSPVVYSVCGALYCYWEFCFAAWSTALISCYVGGYYCEWCGEIKPTSLYESRVPLEREKKKWNKHSYHKSFSWKKEEQVYLFYYCWKRWKLNNQVWFNLVIISCLYWHSLE
jgi:hypothetical protein